MRPKALRDDPFTDNLRFLRALIARPKHIGAIAPSSRALARAIADEVDPSRPGAILELGPGTGVITQALLERGVAQERLIVIEYDPAFAAGIAARFPAAHVIQGDAFDLNRTLGSWQAERFSAIVSGIPLLNFPVVCRRLYVEDLMRRLMPGSKLIQFSYGMHAPAPAPPGHSVRCTTMIWANLPPARVWVYGKG